VLILPTSVPRIVPFTSNVYAGALQLIPTYPLSTNVRTFDVLAVLPRKLNLQPLPSPHEVIVVFGLALPAYTVEAVAAYDGTNNDDIPDNAPLLSVTPPILFDVVDPFKNVVARAVPFTSNV
jgi:hypothetical protein